MSTPAYLSGTAIGAGTDQLSAQPPPTPQMAPSVRRQAGETSSTAERRSGRLRLMSGLLGGERIRVFAARSRRQRLGLNKPSPDPDMGVHPDRRDFTWDCGPGKRPAQGGCGMDRAPVRRRSEGSVKTAWKCVTGRSSRRRASSQSSAIL